MIIMRMPLESWTPAPTLKHLSSWKWTIGHILLRWWMSQFYLFCMFASCFPKTSDIFRLFRLFRLQALPPRRMEYFELLLRHLIVWDLRLSLWPWQWFVGWQTNRRRRSRRPIALWHLVTRDWWWSNLNPDGADCKQVSRMKVGMKRSEKWWTLAIEISFKPEAPHNMSQASHLASSLQLHAPIRPMSAKWLVLCDRGRGAFPLGLWHCKVVRRSPVESFPSRSSSYCVHGVSAIKVLL